MKGRDKDYLSVRDPLGVDPERDLHIFPFR